MTVYYVDLKNGSDEKGDGLTVETAFKTYQYAEDVSWLRQHGVTKEQFLEKFSEGDERRILKRFFHLDDEIRKTEFDD